MTPRIERAINVFLDALNAGTLAKGSCAACAVGNLIAAGRGDEVIKKGKWYRWTSKEFPAWSYYFYTTPSGQQIVAQPEQFNYKEIVQELRCTEFTDEELMKIEHTFETSCKIFSTQYYKHSAKEVREDQIKGLEALVKIMLSFDKQADDVTEVFTSKAQAICV